MQNSLFRALIAILISSLLIASPVLADPKPSDNPDLMTKPGTFTMAGDALIARPLLLLATATGAVLFVVSLPFSILGNNVEQAADKLVITPARATFTRCLGCVNQNS